MQPIDMNTQVQTVMQQQSVNNNTKVTDESEEETTQTQLEEYRNNVSQNTQNVIRQQLDEIQRNIQPSQENMNYIDQTIMNSYLDNELNEEWYGTDQFWSPFNTGQRLADFALGIEAGIFIDEYIHQGRNGLLDGLNQSGLNQNTTAYNIAQQTVDQAVKIVDHTSYSHNEQIIDNKA